MARKSAQPNNAGFIEVQNKAVSPAEVKEPKKKAEKKAQAEPVTEAEPAPVVVETPAEEPAAESAE